MKRVLAVLAVAVFTLGMFSCEPDSSVAETDNLYVDASDGDEIKSGGGSGGQ